MYIRQKHFEETRRTLAARMSDIKCYVLLSIKQKLFTLVFDLVSPVQDDHKLFPLPFVMILMRIT